MVNSVNRAAGHSFIFILIFILIAWSRWRSQCQRGYSYHGGVVVYGSRKNGKKHITPVTFPVLWLFWSLWPFMFASCCSCRKLYRSVRTNWKKKSGVKKRIVSWRLLNFEFENLVGILGNLTHYCSVPVTTFHQGHLEWCGRVGMELFDNLNYILVALNLRWHFKIPFSTFNQKEGYCSSFRSKTQKKRGTVCQVSMTHQTESGLFVAWSWSF